MSTSLTALDLRLAANAIFPNALALTQDAQLAVIDRDWLATAFAQSFYGELAGMTPPWLFSLQGRKCSQYALMAMAWAAEAYGELPDAQRIADGSAFGLFDYTPDPGPDRHCRNIVYTQRGIEIWEPQWANAPASEQFCTLTETEKASCDLIFFGS